MLTYGNITIDPPPKGTPAADIARYIAAVVQQPQPMIVRHQPVATGVAPAQPGPMGIQAMQPHSYAGPLAVLR